MADEVYDGAIGIDLGMCSCSCRNGSGPEILDIPAHVPNRRLTFNKI
jgi:hypothetical protein